MGNAHTNASGKLCIRLTTLLREAMSQPSAGKTLAPRSSREFSRLKRRIQDKRTINSEGTRGGVYPRNISEATDLARPMPSRVQLVDSRFGCVVSVDSAAAAPFAGRNAANVLPEASECT